MPVVLFGATRFNQQRFKVPHLCGITVIHVCYAIVTESPYIRVKHGYVILLTCDNITVCPS